jgi:protein TonB
MKTLLTTLLFTGFSIAFFPAFAQQKSKPVAPTDTTKILLIADTSPVFPGGTDSLLKFLGEHLPFVSMIGKPEGFSILQFVVTETGEIKDISVLRSLHPTLDSAAIQAVKAMPTWFPGTYQGKNAKVRFTLPVSFSKALTGKTKGKSKVKTKK